MMSDRQLFQNLEKAQSRIVTIGDSNCLHANSVGSVMIRSTVNGTVRKKLSLSDVLFYVPKLDTNVISCSNLDKKGYLVHFGNRTYF